MKTYHTSGEQENDMSFSSLFGCVMVVFRGKDLAEHRKLAPHGRKYLLSSAWKKVFCI